MMGDMGGPEQPAIMIHAVKPVIHEIFEKQEHDPVDPWITNRACDAYVIKKAEDKAYIYDTKSQIDHAVQDHEINILRCIPEGITVLFMQFAEKQFQPDNNQVNGGGDEY
jgi:hypothetical protein